MPAVNRPPPRTSPDRQPTRKTSLFSFLPEATPEEAHATGPPTAAPDSHNKPPVPPPPGDTRPRFAFDTLYVPVFARDVFVCSAPSDDRWVVAKIVGPLRRAGLRVWSQASETWPSSAKLEAALEALAASRVFVPVLSPRSQDSPWVIGATRWALEHREGRLIPVVLASPEAGSGLFRLLELIPSVDFRQDPPAACADLAARLIQVNHHAGC